MLEVHEDVVDGVPVFWVDGELPVLTATLRFRAGQIDEPLPCRGFLHLLEHLAFHSLTIGPRVEYNGSVEPVFTAFAFRGPADEVARLLGELTRRLGMIDPGELEHEARVLAQEERLRGSWELENAFAYRWGARGPGVVWYRQFGLSHPEPQLLQATARRWFVRQNAVLALDGPIPDGLRLWLADGEPQPVVLPPSARRLPAVAPDDSATVVTGLAAPGLASEIAIAIVVARLNRSLRGIGSAQTWRGDHLELGPVVHLALVAPDDRPDAHTAGALSVLRQLAAQGPSPAELHEHRLQREQARLDPRAERAAPWEEAEARLLGRSRPTPQAWRAELANLTPQAVAAVAQQWLDSLLMTVAHQAQSPAGLPWLFDADFAARLPAGAMAVKSSRPAASKPELRFHGRVVQLRSTAETVNFDLDGLALYGVNPDGQRILVAGNGDRLVLEPGQWRNPEAIIAAIDLAAPTAVTVPLEPREEVPQAPRGWERLRLTGSYFWNWLTRTEYGRNMLWSTVCVVGITVVLLVLGEPDAYSSGLLAVGFVLLVLWAGPIFRKFTKL